MKHLNNSLLPNLEEFSVATQWARPSGFMNSSLSEQLQIRLSNNCCAKLLDKKPFRLYFCTTNISTCIYSTSTYYINSICRFALHMFACMCVQPNKNFCKCNARALEHMSTQPTAAQCSIFMTVTYCSTKITLLAFSLAVQHIMLVSPIHTHLNS